MAQKLSLSLARKLQEMRDGAIIPSSKLSGAEVVRLYEENAIHQIRQGRTRVSYCIKDVAYFDLMLSRIYQIDNLELYVRALESEDNSRAELVEVARDSKIVKVRSFKGFLVNSYEPIESKLNGAPFTVEPFDGTFTFIYDFESFEIPEDVVVIGIENPENFRMIRSQRELFKGMRAIFLSRYPQSQHSDVRKWLSSNANRYVHFGDLDPAGISIFVNEYYKHFGKRASFFIPDEPETLLSRYGLRERFDKQCFKFDKSILDDMPELRGLCELINRMGVGMDQEVLIGERI